MKRISTVRGVSCEARPRATLRHHGPAGAYRFESAFSWEGLAAPAPDDFDDHNHDAQTTERLTATLSDTPTEAVREATVPNRNGLHSRPVIKFVDMASSFSSDVSVTNVTRNGETVDGKSPMEMMLLEATRGCVLRIEAVGADAADAAEALARLVETLADEDDT